jgi:hypothetical protein
LYNNFHFPQKSCIEFPSKARKKLLIFQENKSRFLENCHGLFFQENLNLLQISAGKPKSTENLLQIDF